MDRLNHLRVFYNGSLVGTLANTPDRVVAFEYDPQWLVDGFSISPFSLPLEKKMFIPKFDPFYGLFGVFNDSLPDGWGRLLVERLLLKNKIDPSKIDSLNRLAIVQESGMGALSYQPVHRFETRNTEGLVFDQLSIECRKILESRDSSDLDELFRLGGSSGGARPKILTKIDGKDWIIKFYSTHDNKDSGLTEYRYSMCAKDCGINMSQTRLFDSKICSGYFGTQRFDRTDDGKRVHMISVSGLVETSHRIPNLDYNFLMKLTFELTKDYQDIEQLFRLMCFNVFAHNRDDHSKNFSFIYNQTQKAWHLSPAYDLTYSSSLNGEHATTVNGNGSSPSENDILDVAKNIGIKDNKAKYILEEIKEKCRILCSDIKSYI